MAAWENILAIAVLLAGVGWTVLLLLPFQPCRVGETLEPEPNEAEPGGVTVVIPARDEATTLPTTLTALARQKSGLRVVVVNDQSSDDTAEVARAQPGLQLTVCDGQPLPPGWTGKLWALEQGRLLVDTEYILLLDADILIEPGVVGALLRKSRTDNVDLVSVMAHLRMVTFWEKLLSPAFIFFFKLVYPFALANRPESRMAAAAGGCILVRTSALQALGGFGAIRDALIDDCALASQLKRRGHRTWIGLSRSVRSHRRYDGLADFWNMVARTAYTQLHYSVLLLLATTVAMILFFTVPWLGMFDHGLVRWVSLATLGLMALSYLPTLHYYRRSFCWVFAMPIVGFLFMLMTWTSAFRYWRGQKSTWKRRVYASS